MKVKEAIKIIKNGNFESLYEAIEAISNDTIKEVAKDLDTRNYYSFSITTYVYKLEDGYIGLRGVSKLNHATSYSECKQVTTAREYKEFITYHPKK